MQSPQSNKTRENLEPEGSNRQQRVKPQRLLGVDKHALPLFNAWLSGVRASVACAAPDGWLVAVLLLYGGLFYSPAWAQDCEIRLSESKVDFGEIWQPSSSRGHGPDGVHAVGQRRLNLSARCKESSKLLLSLSGATRAEQFIFADQGWLSVLFSHALLDGSAVELARVTPSGATSGSYGPSIEVRPGETIAPFINGQPVQGSVLTVQVEIRPMIPIAELRTADAKKLETVLSFMFRDQ